MLSSTMDHLNFIVFFLNLVCLSVAITRHCHPGTGLCYWMSTVSKADWATARKNCQSQGGDLVVMETLELWCFVKRNAG